MAPKNERAHLSFVMCSVQKTVAIVVSFLRSLARTMNLLRLSTHPHYRHHAINSLRIGAHESIPTVFANSVKTE